MYLLDDQSEKKIRAASGVNKARERHYKRQIAHRRITIAVIGLVLFFIFSFNLVNSTMRFFSANAQLTTVNDHLAKVKKDNHDLHQNLNNLKDPDYLTKVLREKYQYSKNNEIIFKFGNSDNQ